MVFHSLSEIIPKDTTAQTSMEKKENLFILAFNSLPASSDFCHMLMSANSLDAVQARHNVGPDLDPIHLTPWY